MDRGQNEGLKPALAVLTKIKQEMQSTNEVTFGDICAFAGAMAIESTGGPRIPVQLGRTDSGQSNMNNVGSPGYAWATMTGEGLKDAFTKAGFGAR
jgi:catalase (peroxidase I)